MGLEEEAGGREPLVVDRCRHPRSLARMLAQHGAAPGTAPGCRRDQMPTTGAVDPAVPPASRVYRVWVWSRWTCLPLSGVVVAVAFATVVVDICTAWTHVSLGHLGRVPISPACRSVSCSHGWSARNTSGSIAPTVLHGARSSW